MVDKKGKMSKKSKLGCALLSLLAVSAVVYFIMNKCVKKTICSDNCDIDDILEEN